MPDLRTELRRYVRTSNKIRSDQLFFFLFWRRNRLCEAIGEDKTIYNYRVIKRDTPATFRFRRSTINEIFILLNMTKFVKRKELFVIILRLYCNSHAIPSIPTYETLCWLAWAGHCSNQLCIKLWVHQILLGIPNEFHSFQHNALWNSMKPWAFSRC